LGALLDPTQLRWQQFWVIEQEKQIIACGQLRQFGEAQELGSLVVAPAWRDRNLGSYLTQHLIAQATLPLYLECLGQQLYRFYQKFGFEVADWSSLSPAIHRKFRLTRATATVLRLPLYILQYQDALL
jgi:amino-acid N-acetyltransferase